VNLIICDTTSVTAKIWKTYYYPWQS